MSKVNCDRCNNNNEIKTVTGYDVRTRYMYQI